MTQSTTRSGGLEVHNDALAVADVAQEHGAEVTYGGTIGTRQGDLDQLSRQRPSTATHRSFVDDAGPGGDGRSRSLTPKGQVCWVGAPSRIPKKAGARGNTARRDALPLARLLRAGALPPVDVPQVAAAASRALTRAREDPSRARQAAKLRLKACWLRHDIRDPGRATWSAAHLRWLSAVVWPTPAQPIVCPADVRAVHAPTDRLQPLEQARHEQVTSWRLPPVVAALQALRGGPGPVAVTTPADRGDLTRGDTPRPLMPCVGLMPAADARGARRRPGSLTTAGHTQARRALVAGAWA